MADAQSLAQKLNLKSGHSILLLNAPEGFAFTELPDKATVTTVADGQYDAVILFAVNRADVDTKAADAWRAVKSGGLFWIAYPKKSGAIKTDINRDEGWETVARLGLDGIRLISLDSTWSVMRFRPTEDVKRKPGSTMARKAE